MVGGSEMQVTTIWGQLGGTVNCTYEDIRGEWVFSVGQGGQDRTIDCTKKGPVVSKVTVKLMYPDIAKDQYGNHGFWTMVYNQGFEVVLHGRKYFAFSMYKGDPTNSTSYCDQTMPGWTHDELGHDWACYVGKKVKPVKPKHTQRLIKQSPGQVYKHNPDFINKINSIQDSWVATHYPEYEGRPLEALQRRAGGLKSFVPRRPFPAPITEEQKKLSWNLPKEFDWRKFNMVSPVRNQGECGSCYSFASMGMLEARLRIISNNTIQDVFAPQDIVECSQYSQGCEGGFPYLIGKYAEDFGIVDEKCNPYKGVDGKCSTNKNCKRHYATHYRYVGGYFGACNEMAMKLSLVMHGPIGVAFEVESDFMHYKGGVYKHTGLRDGFNPLEATNHAVLLVGYGVDSESGLPYWLVKNSWGTGWGEEGYFRILRGVDECAIESVAVEVFPIF